MSSDNIKYLENYLEEKIKEIEKMRVKINSLKEEREKCIEIEAEIEDRLKEIEKTKEKEILSKEEDFKFLKKSLDVHMVDIMRLTVEINNNNKILEDLVYDCEMTKREKENKAI